MTKTQLYEQFPPKHLTTTEEQQFTIAAMLVEIAAQLAELNQFLRNCSNRPGDEPNQICVVARVDQP